MKNGDNSEVYDAWQDLRELFVRKLAQQYYGIEIDNLRIRKYVVSNKPLTSILDDIWRDNMFSSTMYRMGRRTRFMLRHLPFNRN
jgi:hypothetical protein